MASPFSVFRRHQKVLLATLGVAAMIAFVVLPVVSQALHLRGGKDPVVVRTARYGDLTQHQLQQMVQRRQYLLGILERFVQNAMGFRPDLTRLFGPASEEAVVDSWLLAREADRLGVVISDETINAFIRRVTQDRLASQDMKGILRDVGIGEVAFFDMLREELKARQLEWMFQPSLFAVPPAQRWDYYLRVNRKAAVELIPVSVEELVSQVADPEEAVLKQFFEERKDRLPEPNSPEPGFRLPHRVNLEFFVADLDQFIQAGGVSEEEVQEEYQRREQQRGTAVEQPGPAIPETPQPGGPAGSEQQPGPGIPAEEQPGGAGPEAQQPSAAPPETGPTLPGEQPSVQPPEGSQTPAGSAPRFSPGPPADSPPLPVEALPPEGHAPSDGSPREDQGTSAADHDGTSSRDVRFRLVSMAAGEGPSLVPDVRPNETDEMAPPARPEESEPNSRLGESEPNSRPGESAPNSAPGASEPGTAPGEGKIEPDTAADERGPGPAEPSPPAEDDRPRPGILEGTTPEQPPAGPEATPAAQPPAGFEQPPAGSEQPPAGPDQPPAGPPAGAEGAGPVPAPPQRPDEKEAALREIREELAREKIGRIFDELGGVLRSYGDQYNLYLAEREQFPDQRPPKRPVLAQLAAKYGLGSDATGLLAQWELREHELGRAWVIEARSQVASLAYDRLLPFKPTRAVDLERRMYLFWKVDDQGPRVPKFEELRGEVLHTWKLVQARGLAQQRAEQLAASARKSGQSLAGTFADRPDIKVLNPKPFSWLATFGALSTEEQPAYFLSGVEGVDAPGEEFMRAVFSLPEGGVGVAFNAPKTMAYVIRIEQFAPAEVVLWEGFQVDRFAAYLSAASRDQWEMMRAWRDSFRSAAGLEWERPPAAQPEQ